MKARCYVPLVSTRAGAPASGKANRPAARPTLGAKTSHVTLKPCRREFQAEWDSMRFSVPLGIPRIAKLAMAAGGVLFVGLSGLAYAIRRKVTRRRRVIAQA